MTGLPTVVRLDAEPASRFAELAVAEYTACLDSRGPDGVPTHLPRAAGLLFGDVEGDAIVISAIEFVANVRESDAAVVAEFEGPIADAFGDVYKNPGRGFWCDDKAVLRAVRRQAALGRDLWGSIHSHPDWHAIGPRHERAQRLSENPTRMDDHLFRQSGWPVNLIWYIASGGGPLVHRVAGWRPEGQQCVPLDVDVPRAVHDAVTIEWPQAA